MERDALLPLLDDERRFVQDHVLERTPWLFQEDHAAYGAWRGELARASGQPATAFYIVGSAGTGYSLSPLKPGRDFRPLRGPEPASDIDVAVVSPRIFFHAWNTIVFYDQQRTLALVAEDRTRIRNDIYWGYVANHLIPANTNASRAIRLIIAVSSRIPPLRGHRVKMRVYRRLEDLHAYHIYSVRAVRRVLVAGGV